MSTLDTHVGFFQRPVQFLRLSAADRNLWIRVVLVIWAIRLMLWLLPFRKVRELLTRLSRTSTDSRADQASVARVVWAVRTASRYIPAATCLTQALATKLLLGRLGHHPTLRIGVARGKSGELQAHAWVEIEGKVVIGGAQASLKQFTPLLGPDGILW
jgi:Transglutaminase-like superfamily